MLPTVEECQEFKRLIDAGRAAADLKPIEFLNFDGAEANNPQACLSATNLFAEVELEVFSDYVEPGYHQRFDGPRQIFEDVIEAIGGTDNTCEDNRAEYGLPEAILKVTNPFDQKVHNLRERLVEAGVVSP